MGTRTVLAGVLLLGLTLPVTANAGEVPNPVLSPVAAEKRDKLRRSFGAPALEYLESLKGKFNLYRAPSELDPRFTLALYINAKGVGPNAQKMWVLQRDGIGGEWRLAMWDDSFWRRKGLANDMKPPYSWPVSTGRKYRGVRKSGPTPLGVFALDERKYRMALGYSSPGMINVMYIDYHYSGGRRSGVAFHGTTRALYSRLGRIDSHGCIRMTQSNALSLINRLQGRDGVLSDDMRWGDVPRFWKSERRGNRYGYTRDGSTLPDRTIERTASASPGTITDEGRPPRVLTKPGYRALAVIFQD